jgi:hypothetical protein
MALRHSNNNAHLEDFLPTLEAKTVCLSTSLGICITICLICVYHCVQRLRKFESRFPRVGAMCDRNGNKVEETDLWPHRLD